ncbi:histidine phosphatase family protein [Aliikangiella sp. IMCC44632]
MLTERTLKLLFIGIVLCLLSPLSFALNSATKQIFIVRHAEKITNGEKDPSLTKTGHQRAKNLSDFLAAQYISKIYSTDYQRTKQTAEPLASKLKLNIHIYDPKKPQLLVNQVLNEPGNVLIVGHSNTTPELVGLFGGNAQSRIDDSEYDRLYQLIVKRNDNNELKVHTKLLRSLPKPPSLKHKPLTINKDKIHSSDTRYQILYKGQPIGTLRNQVTVTEQQILVSQTSQIDTPALSRKSQITLNRESLLPSKVSVIGNQSSANSGVSPINIDLTWLDQKVTGHSLAPRDNFMPQGKLTIDRLLPKPTYEKNALLALIHFIKVPKKSPYAVNWYDTQTNLVRTVELIPLGEEVIKIGLKEIVVDKILVQGGAPSYVVYSTQTKYPRIVKIDVVATAYSYLIEE